ncbi:hypothetical protein MSHI_35130 [Mycobacterium shinjukuense]|uniref:Uncharacterized protein n=1 Tax=Mycobacterium shinjukuense TaxID=398694 RepID=A0A7I7MUP3_9MYCO|nr:hypothetical protein MSHI_35130 [Mycobacterium shinjukuense]
MRDAVTETLTCAPADPAPERGSRDHDRGVPRAAAPRTTGEYIGYTHPYQLISLGCRTANKPNHVDAEAGAAVVAARIRR